MIYADGSISKVYKIKRKAKYFFSQSDIWIIIGSIAACDLALSLIIAGILAGVKANMFTGGLLAGFAASLSPVALFFLSTAALFLMVMGIALIPVCVGSVAAISNSMSFLFPSGFEIEHSEERLVINEITKHWSGYYGLGHIVGLFVSDKQSYQSVSDATNQNGIELLSTIEAKKITTKQLELCLSSKHLGKLQNIIYSAKVERLILSIEPERDLSTLDSINTFLKNNQAKIITLKIVDYAEFSINARLAIAQQIGRLEKITSLTLGFYKVNNQININYPNTNDSVDMFLELLKCQTLKEIRVSDFNTDFAEDPTIAASLQVHDKAWHAILSDDRVLTALKNHPVFHKIIGVNVPKNVREIFRTKEDFANDGQAIVTMLLCQQRQRKEAIKTAAAVLSHTGAQNPLVENLTGKPLGLSNNSK